MSALLTRDEFRRAVFARDGGRCVVCRQPAVDAHHILERRLWPDGGYYLKNGASVCETHHIGCETTEISVEQIREAAGITVTVLPPHLYSDEIYDKWGNAILPNGERIRGELFTDESVQKILDAGGKLRLFTHWVKYPRTYHLPWSEGMNDDDRMIESVDAFRGQRVVVTEKMDGENTTLYRDHIHARSVTSGGHPTRSWVKNFWNGIRSDIPEGWRICGENLFAKHSIEYRELRSYFLGFSIWNNASECLPWDETQEWFSLFGIESVPVLYDGPFDEETIRSLWHQKDWDRREGYVVRTFAGFSYRGFRSAVAKFVRARHVQTAKHWMAGQRIERNGIA